MEIKITPDFKSEQQFIKFQIKLADADWADINIASQTDPAIASKILATLKSENPEVDFRAVKVVNKIETTLTALPYLTHTSSSSDV